MKRDRRPRGAMVALVAIGWLLVSLVGSAAAGDGTRTDDGGRQVIGHSVQGRPIVSLRSGPPDAVLQVLVVGCIHGDETAGMRVARRLIAGGTGPLSEPESRTAERLIRRIRPDLTIWFHQPFGIVDRSGGDPFVEHRFSQLVGLPLVRLHGRYPGSASRWQNHTFPTSTAFVTELPSLVSNALISRATAAVRALAAELASPDLRGANKL